MSLPSSPDRTEQFMRLLSRHERQLAAYVLALVPHWADADEIVQETKIRLWQQFGEYDPDQSFGAWACAIAKFQVLTYRKRVGRERARFSDEFAEAVAGQIAQSHQDAAGEQALSSCLEKLSPKSRAIVRKYYAGESAIEEIASEFAQTASAIYKSLAASRKALHDCVSRALGLRHNSQATGDTAGGSTNG